MDLRVVRKEGWSIMKHILLDKFQDRFEVLPSHKNVIWESQVYIEFCILFKIVELNEIVSLAASRSVGRLDLQNNFVVDDMWHCKIHV
jgi:hypothetical protein